MTNENITRTSRFLVVALEVNGRPDMSDSHAAPLDACVDTVMRDLCEDVAIFDYGTGIMHWIVEATDAGAARLMGPGMRTADSGLSRMVWNG